MTESEKEKWQVVVTGMGAEVNSIDVAEDQEAFGATTVADLRKLIHKRWTYLSTSPEDLRILFAGKQLEEKLHSGKIATLRDYKIRRGSTLQLVFRLHGGMDNELRPTFSMRVPPPPLSVEQKMHDNNDFSLKFTDKVPDAITGEADPDDQPRVLMSCGHAVLPDTLTAWCRSLLDQQQWELYCPALTSKPSEPPKKCKKKWEYTEVRKVALLNEAEQRYFESKISEYAALELIDYKECPGCRSFVERQNPTELRIRCPVCSKKNQKSFDFCWNCEKPWTGPTSSVKCGNDDCMHSFLPAIRDAGMITLIGIEVPSCRACPTCGQVLEHKTTGCKMLKCPRCNKDFCFLCLLPENDCLKIACRGNVCKKGVVPRQTKIPVWSH